MQSSQIPNPIKLILADMSRWTYVLGAVGCFLFACYALWFSSKTPGNQQPDGEAKFASKGVRDKVFVRLAGIVTVFILGALATLLGFSFKEQLSIPE